MTRVRFVLPIGERTSFEEVRFLDNRSGHYDYRKHKARPMQKAPQADRRSPCG